MTRIVVLGTSSGGLEALRTLAAALPGDFTAPLCIVMHTSPQAPGIIPDLLTRVSQLRAVHPRDHERLKPGHIYVAPPDYHLLVEPGRLRVVRGPKENRFRPAIDPLFRSAAQVFGPGAIGVVLSGNLDDGTSGLDVIKRLGGIAIAQDPEDALFPSMPYSAITHVPVDHIVKIADLAPLLVSLTAAGAAPPARHPVPEEVEIEVDIARARNPVDAGLERIGEPSPFACPECHGVLLRLKEGRRDRFRCHTGHAYSVDSLIAAVGEGVETSLEEAVRALEEAGLLLTQAAAHMQKEHKSERVEPLLARAREARRHSEAIRELMRSREPLIRTEGERLEGRR